VTISYWFEPNVDANRKTAFRSAVEDWQDNTCINLIEDTADNFTTPCIKVGIYNAGSCWLSGMGWPGNGGYSRINLGWCNSDRNIGNMVHEIGHVLGMKHTHLRPDAHMGYWGNGPYLEIHWENIPDGFIQGWQTDYTMYMGSADDGPGDPFIGYAPYDFNSIMHTSATNRIETFPAWQKENLGQRDHLSEGDILQILDVYQCKWKQQQPSLIQWVANPSKCLDVFDGDTSNGNNIQIWDCDSGPNQQFTFVNN